MLRGIIFDLDNTLIETRIDFPKMKIHMIKLLEEHGHPEGTLSSINQTTVEIMECARKIWIDHKKPREECISIEAMIEEIMNQGELDAIKTLKEVQGASNTIDSLKEKGLKLAILTRSHHIYATESLKKLGLIDKFSVILGRGETPEPKPYKEAIDHTLKLMGVKPDKAVMIGDHQIDRDSARNSGTMFIGVNTGRRGLKSWKDEKPPTHFIETVRDLPDYLKKMGLI